MIESPAGILACYVARVMRPPPIALSILLAACGATPPHSATSAGDDPVIDDAALLREESAPVHDWAVAEGWGGVSFVARLAENRIDLVDGDRIITFVEGAELDQPRALLRIGGRLVVAGATSIYAISLSSKERTPVAALPRATSLALDHAGFVVAAFGERGPVRIESAERLTDLELPAGRPVLLDAERREITLVDPAARRAAVYDYARVIGEDPDVLAGRDARPMRPFVIEGIGLTSAEYWPNRGEQETRYPEDVLWGFYPEAGVAFEGEAPAVSATPSAIACAERSYEALFRFIEAPPASLREAIGLGASDRFYLWVNDYSEASEAFPHEIREARLWYWERNPAVPGRIPGYWKWETTLSRDGECHIPEAAAAVRAIDEALVARRAAATP